MKKSVKKAVLNRLSYTIGHLQGIKDMVKADADPMSVLQQTRAISSLIKSVDSLLLSSHFDDSVRLALDADTKRRLNKALRDLVEIYRHARP